MAQIQHIQALYQVKTENTVKGDEIVDMKKPKTGVIVGKTRWGLTIKWHDGQVEHINKALLSRQYCGENRYRMRQ